jgi:predicted DNA-binding ribbon-helix-helix protein
MTQLTQVTTKFELTKKREIEKLAKSKGLNLSSFIRVTMYQTLEQQENQKHA